MDQRYAHRHLMVSRPSSQPLAPLPCNRKRPFPPESASSVSTATVVAAAAPEARMALYTKLRQETVYLADYRPRCRTCVHAPPPPPPLHLPPRLALEGGHGLPAQLLRGRRHLALRVIPRRLPTRPLVAPHTTHHTSHTPGQSGCPHSIPLARRLGGPRYRSASG